MGGFIVFIIVMIVIWTISAVATAANKQKELERRQRLQAELQRVAMQRASGQAPPPRQISPGIAARFPDVLLPPAPPPMRRPSPPAKTVTHPQRRIAKPNRPAQRRTPAPFAQAPVPPLPREAPVTLSDAAPAVASPTSARAVSAVDAKAITRWAKPATLRQQFILTEIFQPPVALRQSE